jgi:hypothetical protein
MVKATKTIRHALQYPPQSAHSFAENQALYNRVVAFYFEVIQAHEGILSLKNKEALTALEKLTHATEKNLYPVLPLSNIAPDIPAMFRRAAINAALGSARAFFSSLKKWRARKEKHEAKPCIKSKKKQPFRERPPVPPRTWNKSAPISRRLVERTLSALHHAQSVDRLVLVVAQSWRTFSRYSRGLRNRESTTGSQGQPLVVAYSPRENVGGPCQSC